MVQFIFSTRTPGGPAAEGARRAEADEATGRRCVTARRRRRRAAHARGSGAPRAPRHSADARAAPREQVLGGSRGAAKELIEKIN